MRQIVQDTQWGVDKYVLMDAVEVSSVLEKHAAELDCRDDSWCGGSIGDLRHFSRLGDERLVAASSSMLSKIEDQLPVSRAWRNVEDVVGSVPNVPAFLAGHPQCMRRRERTTKNTAPLTLFVDLTSGAEYSASQVMQRGIVLLALVRMLVEHRPVTLWAGIAQDVGQSFKASTVGSGTVAWRIDTTPLDLARAGFFIASSNMPRRFGYGINRALNNAGGHWPFFNSELHHQTAQVRLQRVFGEEVCYVPSISDNDPMIKDPVGWVRRAMAQHVGEQEDE